MAFISPRKLAKARRHLPEVPVESPRAKVVSFSSKVVETSIGGTQTVTKTKGEPLVPVAEENIDAKSDSVLSDGSFTSTKSIVLENKTCVTTEEKTNQTNNKENVQSQTHSKLAQNRDVFASPLGPPARSAPREYGMKNNRGDSYTTRRTTQEHLDQMADLSTPPQRQFRRHTLESEIFDTPDCYRVVQLDTPRRGHWNAGHRADESIAEVQDDGEDSCSITVAVRVRPYSQRELADPNVKRVVSMNGNETTVTSENGHINRFAFDFSFWSFDQNSGDFSGQDRVYTSLAQPLLGKAFEGYNTCLFAYGQTGSGKSYSIMGHGQDVGIIPRFCEELFCRAVRASNKDKVKISVEISFFEIYNEKIHDLLASSKEKNGKKATLKVREHPVLGPYVEGLSTFVVNSFEDVEGWITLGTKNRATAATGMNDKSSRSHSVFTIVLTQTRTERVEGQDHDHSITSKINLVDLAGSERQSQAQTSGERLREGANINKSLLTLGKVISVLSERSSASKKRKIFVPYRDSVLTWLLKESLGGNSKTAMIATISPSDHHTEETLSTLRYAHQTLSIVNVVRINEDPKARIIRELRAEIDKLRSQSGTMNDDSHVSSLAEINMLREKLMSKEREMDELSRSWQERLRQAEARKLEESKQLEKSGVAVMVDNQLPNLVNLNEDPQLSELLLYVIKTGQTRVGRKRVAATHDIQLSGALIADNHCIINNMEGIVNITPIGDAPTYVNGILITEPTTLHHGDRVILGGDHYFRFNHPIEVKKSKKGSGSNSAEIKDFEFAKQELLRVQEARLQEELLAAQQAAQAKMEEELERARREAELELNQQKSGYEGKLADLEKTLKEQSLQVQKAERSQLEAHSLIEDLRKQKMMLEQEVLAGRKRQQLEAEAARKVSREFVINKSRILELLETERGKVKLRLDELRQRRAEILSPSRRRRTAADGTVVGQRRDLYKVALLLREANKISQYLKKNLVFSREDIEDDAEDGGEGGPTQTVIKVTNTHHRIYTHWTVAKLEEKVMQMRDLYQNDGDSSADDDEVFNDPDDTWEKENPLPGSSPIIANGITIKSPVSSVGARSSQFTPLSAIPGKRASFGMSPVVGGEADASLFRTCRKLVTSAMDHLNALSFEETVADRILLDCQKLRSCVTRILDGREKTPSCSSGRQISPSSPVVQLVSSMQLLASHCSLWAGSFDLDSPLVRDLLSRLTEQVRTVGVHISHLLQGYETDLTSLVQESGAKLMEEVLSVCRTCGELALATKTRMLRLEQMTETSVIFDPSSQLSPEICQAFLSGCDHLLNRTLQGGLRTLDNCETQARALSDSVSGSQQELREVSRGVGRTVANIKVLLQACQEVQGKAKTSAGCTGVQN